MASTIHGPLGYLLHRLRTGIQTHDDAIKNEQDRLHTQFQRHGGVGGIDAQTLARAITLHDYSTPQNQAMVLALMKQLGYVPHQAL